MTMSPRLVCSVAVLTRVLSSWVSVNRTGNWGPLRVHGPWEVHPRPGTVGDVSCPGAISDIGRTTMFRKQTLREAAAETTHTAAERGAAALDAAIERLQPLLEQAAEKVGPLADDARKRADHARVAAAKYAADTLDSVQPQLNEALDKVSPAVERAQKAVQNDLIPKLIELLHEAAEHPAVDGILEDARDAADEIEGRGRASAAALKGELELPKKSKGKTFVKLAVVAALLGAAAVAVKTFLGCLLYTSPSPRDGLLS